MKIIFLDFDGVICTPRASWAYREKGMMEYLDPVATSMVKRICDDTGAKIVVSSSWRKYHTNHGLSGILGASCPGLGNYLHEDHATDNLGDIRGDEIGRWLDAHPNVTKYVILDDSSDMGIHMKYLVSTSTHDGIGFDDAMNAIKILNDNS
jgi:hypothetical protein